MRQRKPVPFAFVLDHLDRVAPETKPMFGRTAVIVGDRIVLNLCDREKYVPDRGVWVRTAKEHHESLRREMPTLRSLEYFGPGPTNWQTLPADSARFEEDVARACRLVVQGDERIGIVPESRKSRAKKKLPRTGLKATGRSAPKRRR